MGLFSSKTKEVETSVPTVQPQAGQTYSDPAVEMASRQMLDAYFNPEYGMIGRQIPIPIQQVAGLSPQEIQARNLASGLGAFGVSWLKHKICIVEQRKGLTLDLLVLFQTHALELCTSKVPVVMTLAWAHSLWINKPAP